MNKEKIGVKMAKLATEICKAEDAEYAGVVIVQDKQLVVALAGSDQMTEERRGEITKNLGEYMLKMGTNMVEGKVIKEEINTDEEEGKWTAN